MEESTENFLEKLFGVIFVICWFLKALSRQCGEREREKE